MVISDRNQEIIKILLRIIHSDHIQFTVVTQDYDTYVNQAHVIKGNDVLVKCDIPSYVSDFLQVTDWLNNQGNSFTKSQNAYGTIYWAYLVIKD